MTALLRTTACGCVDWLASVTRSLLGLFGDEFETYMMSESELLALVRLRYCRSRLFLVNTIESPQL